MALAHTLTHPLTHSPTHPLTHSLTHSLSLSLSLSLEAGGSKAMALATASSKVVASSYSSTLLSRHAWLRVEG